VAAYEVLALNTAVPQIQAAQAGDSYVMVVNATTPALRITQTGTGDSILVEDAANPDSSPFVVSAAGDVGIGTNAPANKLHVNSGASTTAALIESTGTSVFAGLKNSGSIAYIGSDNTGAFLVQTPGSGFSTKLTVDISGNVGIGTTSSGYKLEVNGGSSDAMSLFNSTNANGAHLRFAASGTVKSYIGGAPGFLGSGTADDLGIRAVGSVLFATNGSSVDMTLNSSGNLGLGVTPSAWYTSGSTVAQVRQASFYAVDNIALEIGNNAFLTSGGSTWNYINTGFATRYNSSSGRHIWYNAPSGTAGDPITFTQAMTLDASGNWMVGGTTAIGRATVVGGTTQVAFHDGNGSNTNYGYLNYGGSSGELTLNANSSGGSTLIRFLTSNAGTNAERARITSGGYFKASNTGTYADSTGGYNEFYQTNNTDSVRVTSTSSAVSGAYGVYINLTADPNSTDSFFLRCYGDANQRASIRSNGGLANYQANDVNLSDARLKTDIAPVASYWDKIKSLEIVSFRYKDQTDDIANIGVIAQQVESVAPEFVSNDGFGEATEGEVPYKTIYTTDMYHAAIKALQEAMARIETLEAEVAALKGA